MASFSTLKTKWYVEGVCHSIYASLDGAKKWTAHWIENEKEREAYVHAFSRCEELVKQHHLEPQRMLVALDQYHDDILTQEILQSKWFSLKRFVADTTAAEEQAVRVAFDVVNTIAKRFL